MKSKRGTTTKTKAWAWRSGLIEFGDHYPKGSLPILAGKGLSFTRQKIEARARHGYDGSLLVPGVPEAPTDSAAYEAFESWCNWLREKS